MSLVVIAVIDSRWGALEPRVSRTVKSNNVFLIKDSPDWFGDTVSVQFPIMRMGTMVLRDVKMKRYFTLDDCFNDFIDNITTDYSSKIMNLSFTSLKLCFKLASLGYFIPDRVKGKMTIVKRRSFVKKYYYPVRSYLIERGWIKDG